MSETEIWQTTLILRDLAFKSLQKEILTVESATSAPPGARVQIPLVSEEGHSASLTGKVVSIASAPDNLFLIRVRLHTITKEHQAHLRRIFQQS
jgi:hypothetical protein